MSDILGKYIWAIITIIVIAALIVLAFVGLNKYRIFQTSSNIASIAAGIESLYSGTSDYSDLTNDVVKAAKIIPASMLSGDNIVTPWNSSANASIVTIAPSSSNSGFTITLSGLPSDVCASIGESFLNSDGDSVNANSTQATSVGKLTTACASTTPATLAVEFS